MFTPPADSGLESDTDVSFYRVVMTSPTVKSRLLAPARLGALRLPNGLVMAPPDPALALN
jgi:hypothetical protein